MQGTQDFLRFLGGCKRNGKKRDYN